MYELCNIIVYFLGIPHTTYIIKNQIHCPYSGCGQYFQSESLINNTCAYLSTYNGEVISTYL